MKIGVLSINWAAGGEATSAAIWSLTLDAPLYTWSASGKQLAWHRDDYPFQVLGTSPRLLRDSISKLLEYDLLLVFSIGVYGEEKGHPGRYFDLLKESEVPFIAYLGNNFLLQTFKNGDQLISLPNCCGYMFVRPDVKRYFLETHPDIFSKKPCLAIPYPLDISKAEFVPREQNRFVSATRVQPAKRTKELVTAFSTYKLEEACGIRLDIWGDGGGSRYPFLIKEAFPDFWAAHYMGWYDHKAVHPVGDWSLPIGNTALETIYGQARYAVDLTNFAGDGGIQKCYGEAIIHGVTPIVPDKWDCGGSAITIPDTSPESIVQGVSHAASLSEAERKDYWLRGMEYLATKHDPESQEHLLRGFLDLCMENA
jgi:hypothetical protein